MEGCDACIRHLVDHICASNVHEWSNRNEHPTNQVGFAVHRSSGGVVAGGVVLMQNRPNPFNPMTSIAYSIPTEGHVTIEVFDVNGRKTTTLVDSRISCGAHQVVWDGTDDGGNAVGSGVYFYRIESGESTSMRKMILLK